MHQIITEACESVIKQCYQKIFWYIFLILYKCWSQNMERVNSLLKINGQSKKENSFLDTIIKTYSLVDFTVASPHRVSQPDLVTGMQPTKNSPSLSYVSLGQMNDGRIKSWQTMRWLQSYVSTWFSAVILCYVNCLMISRFACYSRGSSLHPLIPSTLCPYIWNWMETLHENWI